MRLLDRLDADGERYRGDGRSGRGRSGGNVFNVWYRLAGGKGLGVTLGVLIVAWPLVTVPSILVIALLAWATRSTGLAAIGTLGLLIVSAFLSDKLNLIGGWGVESPGLLSGMSVGFGAVMAPKHIRDALSRSPSRR